MHLERKSSGQKKEIPDSKNVLLSFVSRQRAC